MASHALIEKTDPLPRHHLPPDTRCNWWMPKHGRHCRNTAGKGTAHFGTGRCKRHGGAAADANITHGLTSKVIMLNNPRIQELRAQYLAIDDPLSMERELALQRAILHDYLERFEASQEALMAWYTSWQTDDPERAAKLRPRRVLDLADAYKIVAAVTDIIEKIERVREGRLKAEKSVSHQDLLRVIYNMARIVELWVKDPEILEKIKEGWAGVPV